MAGFSRTNWYSYHELDLGLKGVHSKQKVGQSWSKLVAHGHRAKLVTNGQVTNYEWYVQLVIWAICLWYV